MAAATVFAHLNAELMQSTNVGDDDHAAERLSGTYVTHNTFRMLGVAPVVGRDFVAEDDREGAPRVVMLGYEVWQRRYAGDAVVGRVVRVNGQPATIVGVMPNGFTYPLVANVWMPMAMTPGLKTWRGRGAASALSVGCVTAPLWKLAPRSIGLARSPLVNIQRSARTAGFRS